MKKAISALLALALCAGVSGSAFAASSQSGNTTFRCEVVNEPTFSIAIPSSAVLTSEGTQIDLVASDVTNLPAGQKISVTLAGTDAFRNQMILKGEELGYFVRYQIVTASGEALETTGNGNTIVGKELVSFTDNGTAGYTAKLLPSTTDRPDSYSGTITYGIAVTDAE